MTYESPHLLRTIKHLIRKQNKLDVELPSFGCCFSCADAPIPDLLFSVLCCAVLSYVDADISDFTLSCTVVFMHSKTLLIVVLRLKSDRLGGMPT